MEQANLLSTLEKIDNLENTSVVTNYFNANSIKSGKLVRKQIRCKVQLPEFVARKYDNVDMQRLLKMELGKLIVNFTNTIKKNFNDNDLTNFYNNINEVKINNNTGFFDYFKRKKSYDTLGHYKVEKNTIEIIHNKYSIYHELFHLLSTHIGENIGYFGFMQYSEENGHENAIGYGIDEGYTQFLTQRYFDNNKGEWDKVGYKYQVYVAEIIEKVVGRNQMESLYAKGNLYGLISELQKYVSSDQIYNFINDMDFVYRVQYNGENTTNENMCSSIKRISEFLIICYSKKMIYNYDLKEAIKHIRKFENKVINGMIYNAPKQFRKSEIAKQENVVKYIHILTNDIINNLDNLYLNERTDTIKSVSLNIKNAISNIELFISNKYPDINLNTFYQNIKRISINPNLYVKEYFPLDYSQIYSTLLSMIGTDDSKEIINKKLNIQEFGRGFNDFYSKILTKRYFEKSNDKNSLYIVNELEELIGKKKLESLYLSKNISGLVECLSEYMDFDNIYRFVLNLDFLNDVSNFKECKGYSKYNINDTLEYINKFLLYCFNKKYKRSELLLKEKKTMLDYSKERFKNECYTNFSKEEVIIYANPNLISYVEETNINKTI
ncbi:MAG: hypothetical protein NC181_01345 [Clostridium sp.]|nr:hypothetical protein [Clostridium sp.]MCM1443977.1 hypothetical protein [Candidatus Amulumruptor caecigallinarius]